MSQTLATIESELSRLQNLSKEKTGYLQQVIENIKQLRMERENARKVLSEISGALQAFDASVKLMKAESEAAVAAAPVAPVVAAPADPVPEVAPALPTES